METTALDIQLHDQVDEALAAEIKAYWQAQGVNFSDAVANERIESVIATGRDRDGKIQAVASAPVMRVPHLNNNLMYCYRNLIDPAWRETGIQEVILSRFFDQANARRQESEQGPIGIYLEFPRQMAPEGPMPTVFMAEHVPFYLSRLAAPAIISRVAWFDNVRVTDAYAGEVPPPGRDLPEGYQLELPRMQPDESQQEDIRAFWRAEEAMPERVADERVNEVYALARDTEGKVCAVITVYIKQAPLIMQPVHCFRVFVGEAHRKLDLATVLTVRTREDLVERHEQDSAGDSVGIFTEVESPILAKYRNEAVWPSSRMVFVGMNAGGQQCRILYYPGTTIQDPRKRQG